MKIRYDIAKLADKFVDPTFDFLPLWQRALYNRDVCMANDPQGWGAIEDMFILAYEALSDVAR